MSPRSLLIGLDGATFSILDPLMEQGVMPFLKGLVTSGTRAELRSVIPPLTPPAWTSLMTGRSPGNHGVFDFLKFDFRSDGRYLRVADSRDVSCDTIWSMVSRQGLKSTVLNFPLTFPSPSIAGYVVPGWVPWRHLRLACYPAGLYDRLKDVPGFNPRELAMDMSMEGKALEGHHQEEDYEELIRLHIRRERQWFNILRYLMREDPCPLTAVLFDGVDKLQHFCWRFLDLDHFPAVPSPLEQRIRNLCLDYFRAIDGLLAEIVALAGPETSTVIASDHGFGPTVEIFYLNAWLAQHGYLAWAQPPDPESQGTEMLGMETMARRFYEVDWAQTTAYAPTPSGNGIYLSVEDKGDANGVSARDYERFRRQLRERLLGYTDPATGEHIVTQCWTREEAFPGRYGERAPDLTLGLRDGGFVSILPSEAVLKRRGVPSGTHRPEGVFVAAGPGIRSGVEVEQLSILDIAPVLLYTLGLPVPEDFEGRVPDEILDPAQLRARPVTRGSPTQSPEGVREPSVAETAVDMEAEVLKQLRALGYME